MNENIFLNQKYVYIMKLVNIIWINILFKRIEEKISLLFYFFLFLRKKNILNEKSNVYYLDEKNAILII